MEQDKTRAYLGDLSLQRFEAQGADFNNARYNPMRLGKPLDKLNVVMDYDFDLVDKTIQKLEGVDRETVLRKIFSLGTMGALSETEKQKRLLKFLQTASFHNGFLQPMHRDGGMVSDPLVLLELGEMRCSQVARVAADIYSAAGYPARLVQLGGHVIAEIFFEGRWHYFDADLFGGGQTISGEDGTIPSVKDLSMRPDTIDGLASNMELPYSLGSLLGSIPYPSYFYFSSRAYQHKPNKILYYKKTAGPEDKSNRFFGWDRHEMVEDAEIVLWDVPPRYLPGA
ncbi:MAG: hypothetical protein ACREX4_03610, partial [Gammaproteobacteria bacterium]